MDTPIPQLSTPIAISAEITRLEGELATLKDGIAKAKSKLEGVTSRLHTCQGLVAHQLSRLVNMRKSCSDGVAVSLPDYREARIKYYQNTQLVTECQHIIGDITSAVKSKESLIATMGTRISELRTELNIWGKLIPMRKS